MKQIKQLAEQADKYAYEMNPEQDSYGRSANPRKFQQDRDTKFAELIVRECRKVIADDIDDNSDDDFDLGLDHARQIIGEHFGVEE